MPLDLCPTCFLSGRDPGAARRRHSPRATGVVAAYSAQHRDGSVKSFHLRRETVTFVMKLFDYRFQICHAEDCSAESNASGLLAGTIVSRF